MWGRVRGDSGGLAPLIRNCEVSGIGSGRDRNKEQPHPVRVGMEVFPELNNFFIFWITGYRLKSG